ncbi:amidohydrolase family protein [Xylophilus sp. GW821-FHT01B05]
MSALLPFPVVDIHNHVIADDTHRFPAAPMGGKQSDWSRERPVNATGMLQAMEVGGVAQSVLVQASTCYGHDNRYVAACVQDHPNEFVGVFSVDFAGADAIERIEHWLQAGLSGARVFVAGHTAADASVRLDDPRSISTWEYLTQRRIPVSVQLRSDKLDQLQAVLARCPDALVLLDHCARPALEDGPPYAQANPLFALAKYPCLYLKYTTHNVRESKEGRATQGSFARALADRFGAHRMAWGSNFPASAGGLGALLQEALEATASLSAEEQAWIFSRTARVLYPVLETADAAKVSP